MLSLQIQDLELYQDCPRRYYYTKNVEKIVNKESSDISDQDILYTILIKAYIKRSLEVAPVWSTVSRWADQAIFAATKNLSENNQFNLAISRSARLRKSLIAWYNQIFLEDRYDLYFNVELKTALTGHSFLIERIPFILSNIDHGYINILDIRSNIINYNWLSNINAPGGSLGLFDAMLVDTSRTNVTSAINSYHSLNNNVYNNIYYRSWIYLFSDTFRVLPTAIDVVYVRETDANHINITRRRHRIESGLAATSYLSDTRKTLRHIARGIEESIYQPVINDHCIECPYRKPCLWKE